ncbi:MAG: hypothetical protein HZB92_08390 [Euryarchaeota archaeon]|nr:hypothetical protein [Euryarchaeota archaeon]
MDGRKAFALAAFALMLLSLTGTLWSISTIPQRDGFGSSALALPENGTMPAPPDAPQALASIEMSVRVQARLESYGVYEGRGGSVRLSVQNQESYELYAIGARITWLPENARSERDLSVQIAASNETRLGMLALSGPGGAGPHRYQIGLRLLVMAFGGWHRLTRNGGQWIDFEAGSMDIAPLGTPSHYETSNNYYTYYDKANSLLQPESPGVIAALSAATSNFSAGYTYQKLSAVFDYVSEHVKYLREPEGQDYWQTPDETLSLGTGDCEDYALLLDSMVMAMDGSARLYLLDSHAFAAFWVGEGPDGAVPSIRAYYGTNLDVFYLTDKGGVWLVADPLASFYLGGPCVGSTPTNGTGWDFNATTQLMPIDCTGRPGHVQFWELDWLWGTMLLVTSVTLMVATLVSGRRERVRPCAQCNSDIEGAPFRCACGAPYHWECRNAMGKCVKCGAPFPPPSAPVPAPPAQDVKHD